MGEDVRLKELVSSLRSRDCDLTATVDSSLSYIRGGGGGVRAHSYLCEALLKRDGVGGEICGRLLHCLGPQQALLAAYASIPRATVSAVRWLAGELESVLVSHSLADMLCSQSCASSPSLSPAQELLLSALTTLPDCLANRLGLSVPPSLLPTSIFSLLGSAMLACLHTLHSNIRGGKDQSLVFLATLLSKAAMLGHANTVLSQIVPTLQQRCRDDPLWGRVCCSLFSRVSSSSLEPLLVELVQLVPPSLDRPHPLYLLLGDLALTNQKARLILTHKLWLSRLPGNQDAVYNLIGYLMSWEQGQELLGKSLQSAVGVWSDGATVRRLDGRHHLWLCQLLVLGTTCLAPHLATPTSSVLREGVLRGLQAHLDSCVPGVRERGMAAGQCLMNSLHSAPKDKELHFDLGESEDMQAILQLAKPVREQEKWLKKMAPAPASTVAERSGTETERGNKLSRREMVRVTEAEDSDSDDDLQPFDMSHDPDHTQSRPPRYLRDCLSVLVSPTERAAVEAALSSLPSLIAASPPDLSEVCVELARALIHLHDSWDIPSFTSLRHSALVALTTTTPTLLAPFLASEFYATNHNLRQRLDILEVISSAATELSSPSPDLTSSQSPLTQPQSQKPWQQVVADRVRAKTRIISKGPTRPPPTSTPSRFSSVAPLFFYPLTATFDLPLPALDLLNRDTLLLGHLVRVLGNVVWCACHSPSEPAMAQTLLEILWSLRYHPSSFVRQSVLCALNLAVVATPTNYLLSDMHEALVEATLWVQDLCSSDPDDEVRELAGQALSFLATFNTYLPRNKQ